MCEFYQGTGDDFDWTIHRGPTSSGGTGPSTDMSGKGSLYSTFICDSLEDLFVKNTFVINRAAFVLGLVNGAPRLKLFNVLFHFL